MRPNVHPYSKWLILSLMCKYVVSGTEWHWCLCPNRSEHNFRSRGSSQERFDSWGTSLQVRTYPSLRICLLSFALHLCHTHPLLAVFMITVIFALSGYYSFNCSFFINNHPPSLSPSCHCLLSYSGSEIDGRSKTTRLYLCTHTGFWLDFWFAVFVCPNLNHPAILSRGVFFIFALKMTSFSQSV